MTVQAPADEESLRFTVAAARRMLGRSGCDSGVAGHVSARVDGEDAFWVSAFEYCDETRPETLVKSSFDLERVAGDWDPSPAIEFHAAIYRARPDVRSVIHTHSHWVSVLATTGRTVGLYNVGAVLFDDDQVFVEDDGSTPPVQGPRLAQLLGDRRVLIIRNHGAIIASQSVERAAIEAITLEETARYHLEARSVGGEELTSAYVALTRPEYERYYLPHMWAANLRRLRRTDPDLFGDGLP